MFSYPIHRCVFTRYELSDFKRGIHSDVIMLHLSSNMESISNELCKPSRNDNLLYIDHEDRKYRRLNRDLTAINGTASDRPLPSLEVTKKASQYRFIIKRLAQRWQGKSWSEINFISRVTATN